MTLPSSAGTKGATARAIPTTRPVTKDPATIQPMCRFDVVCDEGS